MKKFIYLFICFLLSAFCLNAQKPQFPDSSFEKDGWKNKTGLNGSYVDFQTTFFYTLNSLFALENNPVADITAYRAGNGEQIHGQSCIKLVSGQVGVGGEYIFLPGMVGTITEEFVDEFLNGGNVLVSRDWWTNETPCALEGWYKYHPVAGDSALIDIGFHDWDGEVFVEKLVIKNKVDEWTNFSIKIPEKYWQEEFTEIRTLFVASAHINWDNLMECRGSVGSTLWIDNISLKYDCQTGIDQALFSTLKASAFPNPATEVINFELNEIFAGKIVVYNLNGSVIVEKNINASQCQLNTSTFATGSYIYKLINENTVFAQGKFVITK